LVDRNVVPVPITRMLVQEHTLLSWSIAFKGIVHPKIVSYLLTLKPFQTCMNFFTYFEGLWDPNNIDFHCIDEKLRLGFDTDFMI